MKFECNYLELCPIEFEIAMWLLTIRTQGKFKVTHRSSSVVVENCVK